MTTTSNSVETTGTTVDEAVEKALEDLEEARENVEVEVLDETPQEARVRVTVRETYAVRARQVVAELLYKMGISAQVFIRQTEDPVMIDVAGDNLGLLIGWRGETLRAFQTVVNLILNEGRADRRRLVVDVEHYRNRREETVKEMALRLAERVRRTGERVPYAGKCAMHPAQTNAANWIHRKSTFGRVRPLFKRARDSLCAQLRLGTTAQSAEDRRPACPGRASVSLG